MFFNELFIASATQKGYEKRNNVHYCPGICAKHTILNYKEDAGGRIADYYVLSLLKLIAENKEHNCRNTYDVAPKFKIPKIQTITTLLNLT